MYTGYTNYHAHGNSHVWQMDNLTAMRQMPDKYYRLAIIDPPYGIGEDGASNHTRGKPVSFKGSSKQKAKTPSKKYTPKNWDKEPPTKEYFTELFRVSKNQIIFGANHFISRIPVDSPCWIVWDKMNGANDFADCELAWTSFKTAVRKFEFKWHGMLQQDMKNKEERIHPTQKPVKLYEWLLKNYAKPGDKILDTHLGSQSSRIAAYKLGFEFHGFELDGEYFTDGNERFKVAVAMPLFDGTMLTAAQCEQKELF